MPKRKDYLNTLLRDQIEPRKGGRYFGVLGDYVTEKMSIIMIFVALYAGAKHHDTINRIEDFILRHNIQIEENYFPDPRGLTLNIKTNEKGLREVYLMHKESKTELPILDDLMPPTDNMIDTLEKRLGKTDYHSLEGYLRTYKKRR